MSTLTAWSHPIKKLGKSEIGVAFLTQMAYSKKCSINEKKIDDIKQRKKYIPDDFLEFYNEVPSQWKKMMT